MCHTFAIIRFCGRDCRALLPFRVPSRPRRGRGGKSPQGRAHDARAFAVGTGTCRQRTFGASSRSHAGMDARVTAAARVCSLWLLSLAQARESDSSARMADEAHRDVSRFSRKAHVRLQHANMRAHPHKRNSHDAKRKSCSRERDSSVPSPYPLPQAGEGKDQKRKKRVGR